MLKIFDFDGTLIDPWPRYYAVFCSLAGADIQMKDYVEIKKSLLRDEMVAKYFGVRLPDGYFEMKPVLLEDREFLLLDKPFFSNAELKKLLRGNTLILSKRKNRDNFKWELDKLGIECRFEVVQTGSKEDWVSHNISGPVVMIGDSVEDLKVGNLKQAEVYMVGYGIGTKAEFEKTGIKYLFHEKPIDLYIFWGIN